MTFTSVARRALVAATAITVFAGAAQAQQIDRIVTFGDSYADDGNFFEVLGINPQSTTIYPTGRFSGGTNYLDTLSQILGVPVENFAIGGAMARGFPLLTDPSTIAYNTNCSSGSPACALGLTYQVNQFFNVGPQSGAFPNSVTTFDQGDLVTVSIGGNDARYYQLAQNGTVAGAPAAAAVSVSAATTELNRLVAAGAPTISFLAGDTSRLPEIAGNTAAQAIRAAYSNAFNSGMQTTLAGYAANGVIVHYLDLNRVLDNIVANPTAFGISNGLTCPSFQPSTPASSTCLLNASGYLFYGDNLHLTSQGFAIVARYVAAQLEAPLTLQASGDVGMDVARQFGRTLGGRLDFASPRDGDTNDGFHFFVVGDAYSRKLSESRGNDQFRSTTVGATLGAEYGFGNGVIGLAGNLSRPKANFANDKADVDTNTGQVGAYAGAAIGGGFVQGYLGYGWDHHDVSREGVVTDMSASPKGHHWLAGAKAGYLMPVGVVRLGPVVGLDYAKAKVNGYTEDGDSALTLNVGSQSFDSLRGNLGLEVRGDFDGGGVQVRPYLAAVVEKELGADSRSIDFAQTSAPIIVNHFDFDDVSKKAYARLTAGGNAQILAGATLDAGISMTFGKDQGNETSGHVGLKFGF